MNFSYPPHLRKLPSPANNKKGWPWSKESKLIPPTMRDGKPWPKISIVTPSYNQGRFLEETIRSVLLQNYPNLEYIIMDGGSTDNSVDIIKKYEPWLTYWVSEKDEGQADAIFRGFERATGEIIAWINSDDYYLSGAFLHAIKALTKTPDRSLVVGSSYHIDQDCRFIRKYYGFSQNFESLLANGMHFSQPACFWRRDKFFDLGGFSRDLKFCFDYDMFLRFREASPFARTLHPTAVFRWHDTSKSSTIPDIAKKEGLLLKKQYGYTEEIDNTELFVKCHRHLQNFSRLGKIFDLWFDPKWILRRWIPYNL